MVDPDGPASELNDTVTLLAPPEPDSRITLNATTSFRPPKMEIFVPSQTEFFTFTPLVARSSSWVTLSSPVFAQTAVIAWAANAGLWHETRLSARRQRSVDGIIFFIFFI